MNFEDPIYVGGVATEKGFFCRAFSARAIFPSALLFIVFNKIDTEFFPVPNLLSVGLLCIGFVGDGFSAGGSKGALEVVETEMWRSIELDDAVDLKVVPVFLSSLTGRADTD